MQAKPFRWSAHALEDLAAREIPRSEAERTLANPEQVETASPIRTIYMRRYQDARLAQEMPLRVVLEERAEDWLVITVYSTSKISKYWKGA